MYLGLVDWSILLPCFAFVLGIGFVLQRTMKNPADFFLSTNLGAQKVIGLACLCLARRKGA